MSCECNETAFNKLRECWSRHHKKGMQGECECCCSGSKPKSKVKGKFGIAYVIDTPNRKCKPCGWEVEFNDTLSEVENNCKKMMHWVTCPPLGECQNNHTNLCGCSEDATKKLLKVQPPCCRCKRNDDNLCKCCKQKKKSEGDGYRKMEKQQASCCCKKAAVNKNNCLCSKANKTDKTNQCCCKLSNNKNQGCLKARPTSGCCKARDGQTRYLESIKRCTECCCIISNDDKNQLCCCKHNENYSDEECCCNKTNKTPNCRCQSSDSQSSFESCECEQQATKKDCCCDCAGCKCTGATIGDKRKKQKRDESKKDERKGRKDVAGSKDKAYTKPKPSKNLQSPEPTKERHKRNAKSPYTITNKEQKKEPDTGQVKNLGDFYSELHERIKAIKNPDDESMEKRQDSVDNLEMKSEIYNTAYGDMKLEAYTKTDTEKQHGKHKKDSNQPTLLQRIKQEHKKEMEAIHPNQEVKKVVEEQVQPTMNISPEISKRKRKLQNGPSLLKKIRQERKKEIEAIIPKQYGGENKKDKSQLSIAISLDNLFRTEE